MKHLGKVHATRVPPQPQSRAAANDRGYKASDHASNFKPQTSTEPVFCPGIGGIAVATDFPETGLVFGHEINRANKLGSFPCIKLRDNHARGPAVIARNRFAVELRGHERVVIERVFDSDITAI